MPDWPPPLDVSADVDRALAAGQPVVALESAVISHGLPGDLALHSAARMHQAVRDGGAVPAVIAVVDGRIRVGASGEDLARLLRPGVMKVAARDLPVAVAREACGGTTVSATVIVAERVGIQVVSTGGIGGVHLGAERTGDISADLGALAAHPVVVVCSGAKAICDVARTLEYLDTAGVTVVAYRTDRFPYFYAPDSGLPAPARIDSPAQAAAIWRAHRALGRRSALVVAQPVPAQDALTSEEVEQAVAAAVRKAEAAGVRGGDLTPFLLAALAELTGGRSLRANLALLRANAALAAEIATALAG
ncbi:MAG: pseudouridine-5'-phosphate glycosidase [Armatimonadota bacterium]|nr:pseudouridine-5'-phosphate glycosidase [Armatimonadota bacterium]MDR7400733.1 pseudouridine-5'-phosphate glycosidase [Armatimonadota bacterium]MDR7405038.1 pseudouridine-5'-phosphate glycosidase [Armatimonadota bacterium]MDR7436456.1 pseudouridine-5'-phosphate glycosidase [Armatimonadota bacterium]MDR7472491.1 pseudouridine-5'-phosphate glycosidase [Armatimonadota bacterium]